MTTEESGDGFKLTVKRFEGCSLMNTWETSSLLKMSVHTLAKMRSDKPDAIPYIKIRNRVYYYRQDVEQYLINSSRRYGHETI